jgi:hypothetical protein
MIDIVVNLWDHIPSWLVVIVSVILGAWGLWVLIVYLVVDYFKSYLFDKSTSFIVQQLKKIFKKA